MKYSLRRTVKPTEAIVSLADARAQLRVDAYGSPPTHPEDDLIESLVTAITEDLDAGTGWLGRALAPQTWELTLTSLPAGNCPIKLPYPPLIEIVSFVYTDSDGATVTMVAGTDYRLVATEDYAILAPPFNDNWPTSRDDFAAVTITYRCGYVEGSPEVVAIPEQVKRYVKAALTEAYDNRDTFENAAIRRNEMTDRVVNTLNNLRVMDNTP